MRCASSTGSAVGVISSLEILRGSSYTSSAIVAYRSAMNDVRIPRRTRGSASFHCWSAWHMMAAITVRWKRSMSPLAEGWWAVVRESWIPHNLAWEWKSCDKLTSLVGGDGLRATKAGYAAGQYGTSHSVGCAVWDGDDFWPVCEVVDCSVTVQSQSHSHITTDGQSVIMSRYRAHSGTCDQILLSVRRLFSEIYSLFDERSGLSFNGSSSLLGNLNDSGGLGS
jgi:hypothetical protein